MSDKGTVVQLKQSVEQVYNNAQSEDFLTPQKHYNMVCNLIDTLAPSYGVTSTDVDNVFNVSMSVTQVAYSEHKLYLITFNATNTDICTLNVDSLGGLPLLKEDNQDLGINDIVVNKIYEVRYNQLNSVFLINI
jgi:hypothetical protein